MAALFLTLFFMEVNRAVFEQFPVIKTERLTLREIRAEDAEAIFRMRSNGQMSRFIARNTMEHTEQAAQLVEKVQDTFVQQQGIAWAGILRDGNTTIGTCGYNMIDYPNLRAEIGGELSVQYWGKNIAQEAVAGIVHFGLHTMGLHSIEAKVSPGNRGAIFLLEQLGFRKEAHFQDRIYFNNAFSDMAVYTLIKGMEI